MTIKETQGKAAIIRESRILKRQSEMDKRYREFELRKKADRKIELENAQEKRTMWMERRAKV